MSRYLVTWDGPEAGKRAVAEWPTFENAFVHYERKRVARLHPQIEEVDQDEIASPPCDA